MYVRQIKRERKQIKKYLLWTAQRSKFCKAFKNMRECSLHFVLVVELIDGLNGADDILVNFRLSFLSSTRTI